MIFHKVNKKLIKLKIGFQYYDICIRNCSTSNWCLKRRDETNIFFLILIIVYLFIFGAVGINQKLVYLIVYFVFEQLYLFFKQNSWHTSWRDNSKEREKPNCNPAKHTLLRICQKLESTPQTRDSGTGADTAKKTREKSRLPVRMS